MRGNDQQAYDRGTSLFSPDGRIYQVEYAREAVSRGAPSVGIRTTDGVILAAQSRAGSSLMESESRVSKNCTNSTTTSVQPARVTLQTPASSSTLPAGRHRSTDCALASQLMSRHSRNTSRTTFRRTPSAAVPDPTARRCSSAASKTASRDSLRPTHRERRTSGKQPSSAARVLISRNTSKTSGPTRSARKRASASPHTHSESRTTNSVRVRSASPPSPRTMATARFRSKRLKTSLRKPKSTSRKPKTTLTSSRP